LHSSVKLRRVRFRFVSAIVDIVSLSWKVSTKPDQAQIQSNAACAPEVLTGPGRLGG
jgi:hypothetical protein